MANTEKPTIVLVHGALTDASIWAAVIPQLQQEGYPVIAPALPMRGLATDHEYLVSVLKTIEGEIVLVGHSYGGTVISQVSPAETNLKSLVYIAAFQPDEGEASGELNGRFPGSRLAPDTLAFRPSPTGTDVYLKPECFREVYAGDLTATTVAVMAATQRPLEASALEEKLVGKPAWRSIRSWALVTRDDKSLPPALLRYMAARANSKVSEVDGSHAVPVSQPHAVASLILEAARS